MRMRASTACVSLHALILLVSITFALILLALVSIPFALLLPKYYWYHTVCPRTTRLILFVGVALLCSTTGKITLIGDFPVSATGGQLIGVGHQYYNTVEVVGYGNDVGDICVNGELTGVLLASTTPLPTQTAAPTNKACVSRVNAPCGSGCCRGLVCSEVEVDGGGGTVGTCVIDTRPVESPPSPPPPSTTPTDGINEEGKNAAPSTWRSSTTGVNTIVASVVGFALIILGIAVVVMVIRR